jgi:hypothetical protein
MVGEEGEAVKELGSSRPVRWYVWLTMVLGELGSFVLAAFSAAASIVCTATWFVVFVFAARAQLRYWEQQRQLGPVRATVVPELEARRVPIRVVASSGRLELPSAERVG